MICQGYLQRTIIQSAVIEEQKKKKKSVGPVVQGSTHETDFKKVGGKSHV